MRMVSKAGLLIVSALGAMIAPAHAASIASPANGASVTATGTLTVDILGWTGQRTCNVVLNGTVDSSGPVDKIIFTSGASTTTACNADDQGVVEFPFSVTATSATAVTVDAITLNPADGSWPCVFSNVALNWNNATSTASLPSSIIEGVCVVRVGANFTISPAVDIVP